MRRLRTWAHGKDLGAGSDGAVLIVDYGMGLADAIGSEAHTDIGAQPLAFRHPE